MSPLKTLRLTSTSDAEVSPKLRPSASNDDHGCQGVSTTDEQRMRRDGILPRLNGFEDESLNGRLKRVNQVFRDFGIDKVTLQVEEDGETCSVVPAGEVSSAELDVEGCTGRTRDADQYSIMTDENSLGGVDVRQPADRSVEPSARL